MIWSEKKSYEVDFHICSFSRVSSDLRLCGRDSSFVGSNRPPYARSLPRYSTTRTTRQPPRRSSSRSHGRCALAKTSRPVNSKSGELSFSISLRFSARVIRSLLRSSPATTRLGELPGCRGESRTK